MLIGIICHFKRSDWKVKYNFCLFVFISHGLLFPLESLAGSTNEDITASNRGSIRTGKIVADENEEIPL